MEHWNEKHSIIKFKAEWSETWIHFLDVTVWLIDRKVTTNLNVKPTYSHQYLQSSSCDPYNCIKWITTDKLFALTKSVQILIFSIDYVMAWVII